MTIHWEWRGSLSYSQAWEEQKIRRRAIIEGSAPEVIWLLEHDPPVVTTGKRPVESVPTAESLASQGTELFHTERGGLATWHGPGQIVVYLLIRAQARGLGVRGLVCAVESSVIQWLESMGIDAGRRLGHPGVWVGTDKICAIGLHFRRGVSMHGLALNLAPDLNQFRLIQPCGITNGWVTSVAKLTGRTLSAAEVAPVLGPTLCRALVSKI
jgi:lipoate-protein ligase B